MGKKIKNTPQRVEIHLKPQTHHSIIISSDDQSIIQHHPPHQHIQSTSIQSQSPLQPKANNNQNILTQLINSHLVSSRNHQLEFIINFLRNPSIFNFLHIAGCSGSGKTLSVSYVIQQSNHRTLWLNGYNPQTIKQTLSTQKLFTPYQFIIIDEFDKIDNQNQVLQQLLKYNLKGILISNKVSHNLNTKYTPHINYLFFTPYTFHDMVQIVKNKLNSNSIIIQTDALNFLAKKISVNSSDIRKVFKLIQKAYQITLTPITLKHIRNIWKKQNQSPMYHFIQNLTPIKRNVLQSILYFEKNKKIALKNPTLKKNTIITLKQLQQQFLQRKYKPKQILHVLEEFQNLGIIKITQIQSIKTLTPNCQIKLITKLHYLSNAIKQIDNQ